MSGVLEGIEGVTAVKAPSGAVSVMVAHLKVGRKEGGIEGGGRDRRTIYHLMSHIVNFEIDKCLRKPFVLFFCDFIIVIGLLF